MWLWNVRGQAGTGRKVIKDTWWMDMKCQWLLCCSNSLVGVKGLAIFMIWPTTSWVSAGFFDILLLGHCTSSLKHHNTHCQVQAMIYVSSVFWAPPTPRCCCKITSGMDQRPSREASFLLSLLTFTPWGGMWLVAVCECVFMFVCMCVFVGTLRSKLLQVCQLYVTSQPK